MKRIGKFALPLAAAMAAQGCILLPVENNDRNDPFFFDPGSSGQSANFVEIGYHQSNAQLPLSASNHCSANGQAGGVDSACWFFPVMRIY